MGKVKTRYRINDNFAFRGSYRTGFRAPNPGQQGTTNVSTRLPNSVSVATGLFLSVGVQNLFDTFSDALERIASDNDQCCGRTYSSGSFAPWQGGYYYARLAVDF